MCYVTCNFGGRCNGFSEIVFSDGFRFFFLRGGAGFNGTGASEIMVKLCV